MALTSSNYVFLPWVRQGAASGIQTPDMSANQAGVVTVSVKLAVNNTPPEIERQVRLYGPGDVTGIDQLQVIRTEPRHLATDFEPNYFPAVEFDRPDFPWLFTPAKANDAGKLRPWLCLVVIRKQEGVTLSVDRNLPLPVLDIAQPKTELPDLSESWAWAHAQVTGSALNQGSLESSLAGNPALTLSRLLCPRRLDPLTDYLACVVPTFELGRKAGLGIPIQRDDVRNEEKELLPAWTPEADSVRLPVYFHWEFRTGTGGDFETLVKLLTARDLRETPKVGKRLVDISDPDFNVTLPVDTTLELEGALRVLNAATAEWPEVTRMPFQLELKKILDAPWLATQNDDDQDPVVAPPIYGCWQAARHTVNITPLPASLTWLDELNLDPRHRAVAALGTQVVQAQQEELMASAWEQLGEIDRINQLRRQAQLARAVNGVYYAKHFQRFSDETLLKVFGVAQSRVVVETIDANNFKTRALLSQRISDSVIPDRVVSAPMRRLTSPRSRVSARFQPIGAQSIAIVARLNTFTPILAFRANDAALVSINLVTSRAAGFAAQLSQTVRFERTITALDTAPPLGNFNMAPEGQVRSLLDFQRGAQDSPDAAAFRKAARDHQAYMAKAFTPPADPSAQTKLLDTNRDALLKSINPGVTIKTRVQASLLLASDVVQTDDPLEPVMDAPEFPQPMYEALRDLSQDFLLFGLEHVPANTVTLLGTNPNFVESFLVGLNAEMSHELLWRNYPTDQRGTYFRQFWDTSVDNDEPDVKAIKQWGDRRLGQNSPNTSGKLVLLIRGELLRRYPNSVIYAVAAVPKDGRLTLSKKPEDERHPLFRGSLKPDVTFLGFDLTEGQAKGEPPHDPNGWFFVIQQQPTEPCFGMDVADFAKDPPSITTSWNELSWRHVAKTEQELKALSHVSLDSIKSMLPNIETQKIDNATWGKNSSHLAYITLQRPMRIAIHAREMIKKV
ncbi:MAG: hypothetical protein ND866_11885 [Pyrinomonadaceae bacterium]|nr:hypothetical protein [Pyrinomonadaceae bacterium]